MKSNDCDRTSTLYESHLRSLLEKFKRDEIDIQEAFDQLKSMPYQDLDFAKVDHHRSTRKGFPEVIFGEGKTPEQIVAIAETLLLHSDTLLVTRASPEAYSSLKQTILDAKYDSSTRLITVDRRVNKALLSGVVVVCAGTSDLPVSSEAAVTAELMGCSVKQVSDVGVAGIHRLLNHLAVLQEARVIVAVAGMEGALPSVIGGLVEAPVIAVPTSIGYGSSFHGVAALLAMLNSCAPGIGVVNIDNGFGAGFLAAKINLARKSKD